MNTDNDSTEREFEALLGRMPSPPSPSDQLHYELRDRVLDAFDRYESPATFNGRLASHIAQGVAMATHPITRTLVGLAAAALLIGWLTLPSRQSAFARFLAPVVNAKSAKFKMVTKNDATNKEFEATGYFLAPHRVRTEIAGTISIADFDRGRMLWLDPAKKKAMVYDMKGFDEEKRKKMQSGFLFGNLRAALDEYRTNKKGQLEELGEKDLDGKRVFGFRLAIPTMVQTIWGDQATGNVVRIDTTAAGPPKTEVVFSDFVFDPPLDESLFASDPPEGYTAVEMEMDVSPATEKEFVAAIASLADAADGDFPPSLDTAGIASAMVKLLKKLGGTDEMSKEQMTAGIAIGKGINFALALPPEADAHYAGKGVKRQGPKAPVFWYKPLMSNRYRVVYSDLSVDDVDKAPDVPGAIRLIQELGPGKGK
jgi:outer membrane lipoprotein-sorting protein